MNIKKILAGVLAGSMVVGCMVMPTCADNVESYTDSWGDTYYDYYISIDDLTDDVFTLDSGYYAYTYYISVNDLIEANVETVTIPFSFLSSAVGDGDVRYYADVDGEPSMTYIRWKYDGIEGVRNYTDTITVDVADCWVDADDASNTQYIQFLILSYGGKGGIECTVSYGDAASEEDNADDEDSTTSGDVNLDGEINYLDAMTVLRYDAELIDLSDEQLIAGDVNDDDSVDSLDAILILRYDAGLIDSFE